jgi:hypothetical protein
MPDKSIVDLMWVRQSCRDVIGIVDELIRNREALKKLPAPNDHCPPATRPLPPTPQP